MNITTTSLNGKSIVKIEGDLTINFVAAAKADLVAGLATEGDILLDLSEVGECDTAGVQLLLMASASARSKGKRFATFAQSASFEAAAQRIGIPAGCFDDQEGAQ